MSGDAGKEEDEGLRILRAATTRVLLETAVAWYTATVTPASAPRLELYERERELRLAIRAAYRAVHGRDL